MKRLIIITAWLLSALLSAGTLHAQAVDEGKDTTRQEGAAGIAGIEALWDEANRAYTEGRYADAAAGYDSIRRSGYVSAKLYYNLGNACFKENRIGPAILNYNRAQRLAPGDRDIAYNLVIANGQVVDRIEPVPEFFVRRSVSEAGGWFSANGWGWMSLLWLAVGLAAAGVYLLASRMAVRKAGFYGAILCVCLFGVSVLYGASARRTVERPDEAVVMRASAPVKSSPDTNSKDMFILHEGTKVTVINALGDWREVATAGGNQGWIEVGAIAMID